MDHDRIVQAWREKAERNDEQNYRFLQGLKFREYGFDPDQAAGELHEQAFRTVDCTRCANCCKSMTVLLSEADVERIAPRLGLSVEQFTDRYLEADAEHAPLLKMRQQPCPFLGSDDRCTIYDVRPALCREYPHTDKERFASRAIQHSLNAKVCPAVFWIVEQLRRRARR